MTGSHTHIITRKALFKDIDTILEIENQRFPHPWKRNMFVSELSHDISFFYVAEDIDTQDIVGYIVYWMIGDEIELHKIAVTNRQKRKGIGKTLLFEMLDIARRNHVCEIFLEVRASNTEAIMFYESYDFKQTGVRKEYYNEPVEDALIYRLMLQQND